VIHRVWNPPCLMQSVPFIFRFLLFSFIRSFIDADRASPLLFVSKWNKREQHWSNLQNRAFWKRAISLIRSLYIITASVRYDAVSIYRKVFEKLV
jgi:hypothetical protein